ncbi:hypothetical protein EAF64_15245 [Halorientalis pallida]|uniref:EF-hand domain-containing protein n=1 Tax=Halorientalis pallida TaxID=2479928 RepID=A0A498KTK3_9EURY|nr:hypothetical protein EAF64_15245 [Halorientalis pallida]
MATAAAGRSSSQPTSPHSSKLATRAFSSTSIPHSISRNCEPPRPVSAASFERRSQGHPDCTRVDLEDGQSGHETRRGEIQRGGTRGRRIPRRALERRPRGRHRRQALGIVGPPSEGGGATPTDPDGDGLYEDLNGNGTVDYDDVVGLYDAVRSVRAVCATCEPVRCG